MYVHKIYGPVVPEKSWVPAPSYLMRRNRLLTLMDGLPHGCILEVGCGSGALLFELAERGFRCAGLESSPVALDMATYVNGGRVPVSSEPDVEWGRSFDYVMALEVLEHIQDDSAALLQWRDWLKPGGRLLLSVPAHENKWTDADVWAGHYRRYERAQLASLLVDSGLVIERFECWGFPLSNLLLRWRSRANRRELRAQSVNQAKRSSANAQSGINRKVAMGLYPLMASSLGCLLMRTGFALQNFTTGLDWGVGYLVQARKL